MSDEERAHWDRRYAEGEYVPRTSASPFLLEWLERVPVGRALDIATGTGRNALALAEAGFVVDAVDISEVAIEQARGQSEQRGLDVNWIVADLDADPLPGEGYDLVTVVRYRPSHWSRLRDALAPDGWILVDHHLKTSREDAAGPSSEAFRVAPGELLHAFAGMRILHYAETVGPSGMGGGEFVLVRCVACAGDPGF